MSMLLRCFALFLYLVSATWATAQADPSSDYFEAARHGSIPGLKAYLDAGGTIESRSPEGFTALILAAYNGQSAAVEFLLAHKADPCATDPRGNTALMGAIFKGNAEIAARFITTTCDIDQVNAAEQTALMYAALFNRTEIAKAILAKGADPARRDAKNNTAESVARAQGSDALADLLASPRSKR